MSLIAGVAALRAQRGLDDVGQGRTPSPRSGRRTVTVHTRCT